jgi:hypothetical protein
MVEFSGWQGETEAPSRRQIVIVADPRVCPMGREER